MSNKALKITVITPSYNQAGFIDATIRSVLGQAAAGLEYIVVDGGSTDGTIDILRSYEGRLTWISEPDQGLADAVNKGVAMAKGEIIGWINSDDLYMPGALEIVSEYFRKNPGCGWLFGKCVIIDSSGRERWKWITGYKNLGLRNYSRRKLIRENFISQPAVFFRKDLFDQAGGLDISLKYAMDYDLWLRLSSLGDPGFIDRVLSSFRRHNRSKSETGFRAQFREQYSVALKYQPKTSDRFIHWFNIMKIITAYRFIGLFSRF